MKVLRGIAIYAVLSVVGAVLAVLVVSWIPQETGWFAFGLLLSGAVFTSIVTAIGKRLTGWPVERDRSKDYLPVRGSEEVGWRVQLIERPSDPTAVATLLADEYRVGYDDTFRSLTHDPIPVVIGEQLTHHEANRLANALWQRGATTAVGAARPSAPD